MNCLDFDWQVDEFMVYCRSTQLREKTMNSYEQALRLFERWCAEELNIVTVDKVTEPLPSLLVKQRISLMGPRLPLHCRRRNG